MKKLSLIPTLFLIILASCSRKIIPEKPSLTQTKFVMETAPESEINIPIQVSLLPFYQQAEAMTDTVYTSPDWPSGWVQSDCATRYKYHFRRGPLRIGGAGAILNLGFTGYYQIIGSTRGCVGGAVITPWTPGCRCGFDEGERKVEVNFSNKVSIAPNYTVSLSIEPSEPKALDKCSVCFWGQDITNEVMKGLKAELDEAKAEILNNYGTVNLQPQFQQLWNQLNDIYPLYDMGWLKINPSRLRINKLSVFRDSLFLNLGLSARPEVSFEKPEMVRTVLPPLSPASQQSGFNVFLDARLNYDSLSRIANAQAVGKRIDFDKGVVKKYIVVRQLDIYGADNEKLIIKVSFDGSESGFFYLTGKPVYDPAQKILEMRDLDFDIKTRDMLVKTASWMFNKKIISALRESTRFDLREYVDSAIVSMNQQLNREWMKGVSSYGEIRNLSIEKIYPLKEALIIRSNCSGLLSVKTGNIDFSF